MKNTNPTSVSNVKRSKLGERRRNILTNRYYGEVLKHLYLSKGKYSTYSDIKKCISMPAWSNTKTGLKKKLIDKGLIIQKKSASGGVQHFSVKHKKLIESINAGFKDFLVKEIHTPLKRHIARIFNKAKRDMILIKSRKQRSQRYGKLLELYLNIYDHPYDENTKIESWYSDTAMEKGSKGIRLQQVLDTILNNIDVSQLEKSEINSLFDNYFPASIQKCHRKFCIYDVFQLMIKAIALDYQKSSEKRAQKEEYVKDVREIGYCAWVYQKLIGEKNE